MTYQDTKEIQVPSLKSNHIEKILSDVNFGIQGEFTPVFNFDRTYSYEPFAMLMMQKYILNCGKRWLYKPIENKDPYRYGGVMQFYSSINIDFGFRINERKGSKNHIPITKIGKNDIEKQYIVKSTDFLTELENIASEISRVLSREHEKVDSLLKFSIREMLRNIFEHSSDEEAIICAQYWPSKNLVELAVSDNGIGIKKSLRENKVLRSKIVDDEDAIQYSIKPGVSKIAPYLANDKRFNRHDNSGFGLYLASEISARLGGGFAIHSGDTILRRNKNHTIINKLSKIPLPGTTIMIQINPTYFYNDTNILNDLVLRGESEAKSIEGAILEASSHSKRLF